jgi:hypothetical protein
MPQPWCELIKEVHAPMKKASFGLAVLIWILPFLITACAASGSGPSASDNQLNTTNPDQQSTALSAQNRVVLAEMFTGDW